MSNDDSGVKYEFKTLLAYGRSLSGVGWLLFIIGIILAIIAIAALFQHGGRYVEKAAIYIPLAGGIFLMIGGVVLVINGQVISCFVSIERNTRGAWEALKKKDNSLTD